MKPILKAILLGAAMTVGLAGYTQAQSSSGNITGEAVAGDTIVIHGADNGFHRELKIEKDGKYNVRRVPTGDYTVVKMHADGSFEPGQAIVIHSGSTGRVR